MPQGRPPEVGFQWMPHDRPADSWNRRAIPAAALGLIEQQPHTTDEHDTLDSRQKDQPVTVQTDRQLLAARDCHDCTTTA